MTPTDYPSFGLQDKMAIVTGASQGIGRAIAVALARAGAHLVLATHPEGRQDQIQSVKSEIETLGRPGAIGLTDVSDVGQIQGMVGRAMAALATWSWLTAAGRFIKQ